MKNAVRFLKKVTVLSIIMNIIITFATLILCFLQREITAGILSALLGAWSIELALSALIKTNETKSDLHKIINDTTIQEEVIEDEVKPDQNWDSI